MTEKDEETELDQEQLWKERFRAMKRKPGRPKKSAEESRGDSPPIRDQALAKKPRSAIFAVIEEASVELEAALEAFDDEEEDDDSHVFAMERLQRASGLLRGTVLILKDNGGKL